MPDEVHRSHTEFGSMTLAMERVLGASYYVALTGVRGRLLSRTPIKKMTTCLHGLFSDGVLLHIHITPRFLLLLLLLLLLLDCHFLPSIACLELCCVKALQISKLLSVSELWVQMASADHFMPTIWDKQCQKAT